MNPVILTFPAERGVFLKEENAKLYKTSSYFTGSKYYNIKKYKITKFIYNKSNLLFTNIF